MKNIFKEYLFEKHILVNDFGQDECGYFYSVFTLGRKLGIEITEGKELACLDIVKFAAEYIGTYVPEPFYRGFPKTVVRMTKLQLLFDQLLHYYSTYGLGNFDEETHSLMESEFKRLAFRGKSVIKQFIIVNEDEAVCRLKKITDELLSSSRPISLSQLDIVLEMINEYGYKPENVNSLDTAIKLLYKTGDFDYVKYLKLSDTVKLVDYINFTVYCSKEINKLNLKNKDRKFITRAIDCIFENGRCDITACYEKRATWCGILHHLHYKPKNKMQKEFLDAMRSGKNLSAYSEFERLMSSGDIIGATSYLKKAKGSGAVLRSLDYIASRCKTDKELSHLTSCIYAKSPLMLLQLMLHYGNYETGTRTFKFVTHGLVNSHTETSKESRKRLSRLSPEACEILCASLKEPLKAICKGRLGKVYIDENMKNIAVPLQDGGRIRGLGVLPSGSRIPFDSSKRLRAFTYWSGVNDIDLACIALEDSQHTIEFSWRSMASLQKEFITFSGDITNGMRGGSEYFDILIPEFKKNYPNARYLVFTDNVYSCVDFSQVFCKAGYMLRDVDDSGKVFEPKTVKSAFRISAETCFAYLFAIDLRKSEMIWLNVGDAQSLNVAGLSRYNHLYSYFKSVDILSAYDLFSMLATEIVATADEAEVVVSDETLTLNEGVEQIHSYDTERMIQLIN